MTNTNTNTDWARNLSHNLRTAAKAALGFFTPRDAGL